MRFQKFQKILKLQRRSQIGFFCFSILVYGSARTSLLKFFTFWIWDQKISNFWIQRSQRLLMRFQKFQKILKLQRRSQIGLFCFSILVVGTARTSSMKFLTFWFGQMNYHAKLVFTIDFIGFCRLGGIILNLWTNRNYLAQVHGNQWTDCAGYRFSVNFPMSKIARTPLKG